MNCYITADKIGAPSGGGAVTYHELEALKRTTTGQVNVLSNLDGSKPFELDEEVAKGLLDKEAPELTHFYAGSFSKTIDYLKSKDCKVTSTAAAHDIQQSVVAHADIGLRLDLPHLIDPNQFKQYVRGYLDSDVLIVPSSYSERIMRKYGREGRIVLIPHGCDVPVSIAPFPKRFTVGYLGSLGADKGVCWLLRAWKKLNYKDSTLVIAGKESNTPTMAYYLAMFGGGNIQIKGWVNKISDFYNNISLYTQPSSSEGFGLEVLEAMAHGRPVACSTGAGAVDLVDESVGRSFPPRSVDAICEVIEEAKSKWNLEQLGKNGHERAKSYTWEIIREKYLDVWRELCPSK
jgi:glycosyltransferase involved in cell wall biosynthesis